MGCSPVEPHNPESDRPAAKDWRIDNWGTRWIGEERYHEEHEASGVKTVKSSIESRRSAPDGLFRHAVRKYHSRGLSFYLSWHDDDGGLGIDPMFAGDCTVCAPCFGEMYSHPMLTTTSRWFDESNGDRYLLVLDSEKEGYEEIRAKWFEKYGMSADQVKNWNASELAAFVGETLLSTQTLTIHIFPKADELLYENVVNRIQFFNELLLKTWSAEWFHVRNIQFGSARFEDLTDEEYDKLICEAYPDYADDYMRHESWSRRVVEPECPSPTLTNAELPRSTSSNDDDFFAKLSRT